MTNFAEEAAALTNQFRQENGLPALQMAPVLLDLSAQRAEELSQTYGHNRPDGREWFSVIEDSTLDSNCYAAENVAAGYDTPAVAAARTFFHNRIFSFLHSFFMQIVCTFIVAHIL